MTIRHFRDPQSGRVAIYEVPTDIGDPDDPAALCNAPLNDPANNLQYLYYHSDYDPMEAVGPIDITINHGTVPANPASGGAVGQLTTGVSYGGYATDYAVHTHGLGYVPDFLAVVGSDIMSPGYPVQFDLGDGRCRFVTFYATTTEIRAYEFAMQTSAALGAISIDYSLLILKAPPAPTGDALFDFDPDTNIVKMALEKFSSDRKYLQIVAGGSPFALPTGKTVDLANGTFRSVSASGAIRDIVPSSFAVSFGGYGSQAGPTGDYNGSFTGEPVIQVQAP
jgi:hypothetical protein